MASTFVNVGPIKGLDFVGFRPSRPLKLNSGRTQFDPRPPRIFTVRAGDGDGSVGKTRLSDAECEAAVVAGNVPLAPPAPPKPAAPAGTPVVPLLVSIAWDPLHYFILECQNWIVVFWWVSSFFFCCNSRSVADLVETGGHRRSEQRFRKQAYPLRILCTHFSFMKVGAF